MDSTQLHIGNDMQVFADNSLIECTQGLTRRWHKPRRAQEAPVIRKDQPWEDTPYFTYPNYAVLRDLRDGLIKCWYEDCGPLDRRNPVNCSLLYAESEDGVNFRKPALDVCVVKGRKTNIVMGYAKGGAKKRWNPWAKVGAHSNTVIIDPHASKPDERFRTLFSRANRDQTGMLKHVIECAHSADGIHWISYGKPPCLGSSGGHLSDVSTMYYDEDAREFIQLTRHGKLGVIALPPSTPFASGWFGPHYPLRPDLLCKRRVFLTRSHDFLHWADPVVVSPPDDDFDNLDEAHYGMGHFTIGRLHFGLLGIFQYVANEMEVRLVFGRDGLTYRPADRGVPFFAPRGEGHWDAHMVSMTSAPIEWKDEWLFYHGGCDCHHDWWLCAPERIDEPENRNPNAHVHFGMGLAVLRKEGIVSLDGSRQRDGYVVTRPVMSPGRRLIINARCWPGGSIRAAALDLSDRPLGNCALEKCDAFNGDATDHPITWARSPEIAGANDWRKLHFFLHNAELFGFRFAEA